MEYSDMGTPWAGAGSQMYMLPNDKKNQLEN